MSDKILQAAHRFVPPGLQSLAVQPSTHQVVNMAATGALVLLVLLMAQPKFGWLTCGTPSAARIG